MPSIVSIPEIVNEIGLYIKPSSLANCVLVSKLWFEVFTPLLWDSITYNTHAPSSKKEYEKPCITKKTAIKHHQHIHNVTSDNILFLKTLLPFCTKLQYINISAFLEPIQLDTSSPYTHLDFFNEIFLHTVAQNPNIKTLIYNGFPSAVCITSPSLLRELLLPLESLTDLRIHFRTSIILDAYLFLAKFSKQLNRLCISFQDRVPYNIIPAKSRQKVPETFEMTQLRKLSLDFVAKSKEDTLFLPLLEVSPNLETLKFPCFDPAATKTIVQTIQECCPRLRDIDLDPTMGSIIGENLSDVIHSCQISGLRSLRYTTLTCMLCSSPLDALYCYSTTLESLSIPLSAQVVPYFLMSVPNLRILEVLPVPIDGDNRDQFCQARDLDTPWACTKLVVLRMRVESSIDFHQDITTDYSRILLHRLSKLKQLQVLDFRSDFNQSNWVNFGLGNGLSQLSELKNLKMLGVKNGGGIFKKEVDWMIQNWPNLERIAGHCLTPELYWNERFHNGEEVLPLPVEVSRLFTNRSADIEFKRVYRK